MFCVTFPTYNLLHFNSSLNHESKILQYNKLLHRNNPKESRKSEDCEDYFVLISSFPEDVQAGLQPSLSGTETSLFHTSLAVLHKYILGLNITLYYI